MRLEDFAYAPFWCEENVWHLARDPRLPAGRRFAVFVTSATESVMLWAQRLATASTAPVVWDYHVFLVVDADSGPLVFDFDSTLPFPAPLPRYLSATFPFARGLAAEAQPRFRLVRSSELRRTFASDRSHMQEGDGWRSPPPPWPLIQAPGQTMTLGRFLDPGDDGPGTCLDLEGLRRHFGLGTT